MRRVALGRATAAAGLLLLVVTWCLSSIAQIRDSTNVDHTSAVWAGLAQYASDGVLYPALERGGYYGGTRYMPVPVLLHAAAARATGEYFVAAKLLSCFYVLACVGLLLALARRLNAGMVLTALLLACVLLTRPVWSTASAGNPDGLPLAFQLLALLCVLGGRAEAPSPLRLSAAALLCSLAVFSKLSAVWAPAAIVLWLVRSHPRRALLFFGTCLIAGGILFGLTMLLSEGRFLSDALAISFTRSARAPGAQMLPSIASALLAAANRVATLLAGSAPGILVLLPFALATCLLAWSQARARLLATSLALSCLALLVVFSQDGTYANHLIDLVALSTALLSGFSLHRSGQRPSAASQADEERATSPYRLSLGLAVTVALAAGVANVRLIDGVRGALSVIKRGPGLDGSSRMGLLELIPAGSRLLSENPGVCVARGETPVMLDCFMFLRAALKRPSLSESLAERISAREFTHVVLEHPLDAENIVGWYANAHFGPKVIAALASHYRLESTTKPGNQEFYVHVPK